MPNLYEMYLANDMSTGFWVKRRNWGDLCARIVFVGELERGIPCFGYPPVRAELYSFATGALIEADAEIIGAGAQKTWHQIPPPPLNAWQRDRRGHRIAA